MCGGRTTYRLTAAPFFVTKTDIQARIMAFLPLRSWNSTAAPPRNPAGDTTSHCCHPNIHSSPEAFPWFYLKRAQAQLDVQSGRDAGVLRQEGKHCVVHPKQRDQKKSGFGQPPVEKARKARLQIRTSEEQKLKRINNLIITPSTAHWRCKFNLIFFHKLDPNILQKISHDQTRIPENVLQLDERSSSSS